jgi:hypothetical protein
MNKNDMTYAELKRLVYAIADHAPDGFDGNHANEFIMSCPEKALDKLDDDDYAWIKECQNYAVDEVKHLGEKSALELIAAVGNWLNERMA